MHATIDGGDSTIAKPAPLADHSPVMIAERRPLTVDRDASATDRESASGDRESAALDPLTGVFLRLAGFVQLEREMARAKRSGAPLVVAFVDVDQLKVVNDTRGHIAGDDLLRTVVSALRSHLRAEDLIFRYGGDEFVCAFVGMSCDDALERLELVRRSLAADPAHASISVGLDELRPTDSPTDLIRRADAALYRNRRRPLDAVPDPSR